MTKCETGCKHFTGGEVKHHKDCIYYKDSLSEMFDNLKTKHDICVQQMKGIILLFEMHGSNINVPFLIDYYKKCVKNAEDL